MWSDITKRWVDLFFWWVPKAGKPPDPKSEPAKAAEPAKTAAEPAKAASEPPPPGPESPPTSAIKPPPAEPDDLTTIKGIGPATQDKLRGLGIATFKDLAAARPEELAQQLKGGQPISEAQVRGWTAEAGKRAKG